MKSIALKILSILGLIGAQASPILADSASLPEFVPSAGRTTYDIAVHENNASTQNARAAAEALSAKFADITTGSISKADAAEAEHPPVTQQPDARSIVLASNQSSDVPASKSSAPVTHAKGTGAVHRIPQSVVAKNSGGRPGRGTQQSLPAIGEKVGFIDLLTNPAFWR
jgi:hypothetical protein